METPATFGTRASHAAWDWSGGTATHSGYACVESGSAGVH